MKELVSNVSLKPWNFYVRAKKKLMKEVHVILKVGTA